MTLILNLTNTKNIKKDLMLFEQKKNENVKSRCNYSISTNIDYNLIKFVT